jgi:hypothetical protein
MASVLEKRNVSAMNVDALNVTATSARAMENGFIFTLGARSTDGVFTATQPATGSLGDMYMVFSSENPKITDSRGNSYQVSCDPRDRIIAIGDEFDAFKLQVGDIIAITAEGLGGTKGANTFVEAVDGSDKLTWAASATQGSTALRLLNDNDKVRIANVAFPPSSYVDADLFIVEQVK